LREATLLQIRSPQKFRGQLHIDRFHTFKLPQPPRFVMPNRPSRCGNSTGTNAVEISPAVRPNYFKC
jgi:hypothetical protein